ncbi:MAG: acyl-CoA dehydrogenase family protein [Candidatus Brocadiae bacterium]|nr:acyl-CoA dehydrogenase family protein [Candidatus Brocadiia bacterium]
MVDFRLTEEQKALVDLARKFGNAEIRPIAARHDESHEFPHDVFKKALDLGLLNVNIPVEYGGTGMTLMDECLINEELGAACPGIAASMEVNNLSNWPIVLGGSPEIKKKYLPKINEGWKGAYALTEPEAGSDVAGIQSFAKKDGDGYVLNGSKQFITNGSVADFYCVFAYTDKSVRYGGMSCFLVERAWDGVRVGKKEDKMGQRASDTCSMSFEDVRIPKTHLLGNEGDGFKIAMHVFDHSRPAISAIAVGCARRAMEESIRFASERRAFGKPISELQAVSFMIADMAVSIDASRLLVWQAASMMDQGIRNSKQAAFAKVFAADTAMKVTTDAVQVFGGYGYSREYPVEKLMRDAKIFQIYEGTSQIQRVIIGREIFHSK